MENYHIDLPNLTHISSNGNGFCRPRTVILDSNERIKWLTDVDIPKCHDIRLFNSFQKVQCLEINSKSWLDVSNLLDISHDLAQVVYQGYLPALNNSWKALICLCQSLEWTLFYWKLVNVPLVLGYSDEAMCLLFGFSLAVIAILLRIMVNCAYKI